MGARGYQPGVLKRHSGLVTFGSNAYADDVTLYTGGHSNLSLQADKVSSYASWGNLTISQTKTIATAALYKRQPSKPFDKGLVQRLISTIKMQGKPIMAHDPKEPYKLLGVWFTMDLNWKKQFQETCSALRKMAGHMGNCYNSQAQKLLALQTCLKAKARYPFPLLCYNERELAELDRVMDSVVRIAYKLPKGTPTAMIREDLAYGGLGNTSLTVTCTAVAVKNLTHALAEEGKRGLLTRALLRAQVQAYAQPSAEKEGWVPNYAFRLRQLIQGTQAGIYIWKDGEEVYPLPATEVAQTVLGNLEEWERDSTLQHIKKPLQVLQEVRVYSISQLVNSKANRLLGAPDVARKLGRINLGKKHKRALQKVLKFLADAEDQEKSPGTPADHGYKVDSRHARWLKRMVSGEQGHIPVPPATLADIYERAPVETFKQESMLNLHVGNPSKRKRAFDPGFRQCDPTQVWDADQTGDSDQEDATMAIRQPQTACHTQLERVDSDLLAIADPETDGYTLTRKDRAWKMLSLGVPDVTVYNLLAAFKDKAQATGHTRFAGKHTQWKRKTRRLLQKQIQWEVNWAPTILEGWEKDIAMEKLRYKARVIRPATDEDLQLVPVVCEHCHQTDDSVKRCLGCKRGFHETVCELQKVWQMENSTGLPNISQCELINEAGYCWECQRFDPDFDRTSNYQAKGEPWYIEWESHYEGEDTMRGLGFADLVERTIIGMSQPQTHQACRQAKDAVRDKNLPNRERQGNQGPRLHATIGEECRQKCTFVTQDTDPHVDIVGTGAHVLQQREVYRRVQLSGEKKKDYHRQMVTVHDPTGRTVGMITPERLALLYHNYTQVLATRQEVVDKLQPRSFPEEVAALLRRYKEGTPIPGTKRKVDLKNHWATPPGVYQMLQEAIPQLSQERFASPLNYHPGMTKYWSAFERDQLFGAMHDAYKCRWTGHSVANPEYDSKEMYKAVSWAVHSAENTGTPSVTVFVLPAWTEGSNTAYMKWVRKMPQTCKVLATIPRRSFKFIQQPQATTVGLPPEDTGHPKWDINILLVGNKRGFETLTNGDAVGMAKELKQK